MNQKGVSLILLIILVFIAVILIAGGYYWFQTLSLGTATSGPILHLEQISNPEEFPNPTSGDATGSFCGGIAGTPCPSGFICNLDGSYPDAGGKCVKE